MADPKFRLTSEEVAEWVAPERFVGRAPEQVDEFLTEVVAPALQGAAAAAVEAPRI